MSTLHRTHGRAPRRFGVAVALNILMPGLGHLYSGRLRTALAVWAAVLSVIVLAGLIWARWLFVPLLPAVVLVAAWIGLQLILSRDLARSLRRGAPPYELRSFNHPLTYLAFWLGLGVLPLYATAHLVCGAFVGSMAIVDDSMFPKLLPGDRVLIERRAYRTRAPVEGDLVVVRWPPGSVLIGRVLSTAGHTIHLDDGHPVIDGRRIDDVALDALRVERFGDGPEAQRLAMLRGYREQLGRSRYVVTYPEASHDAFDETPVRIGPQELFIMSDNRAHALASGQFGRVPLGAVIGRPHSIWASVDQVGGLRAGRVGRDIR